MQILGWLVIFKRQKSNERDDLLILVWIEISNQKNYIFKQQLQMKEIDFKFLNDFEKKITDKCKWTRKTFRELKYQTPDRE